MTTTLLSITLVTGQVESKVSVDGGGVDDLEPRLGGPAVQDKPHVYRQVTSKGFIFNYTMAEKQIPPQRQTDHIKPTDSNLSDHLMEDGASTEST